VLLLELCHILAEHLITVAVWRPDDLLGCDRRASIEAVARFYRSRQYDHTMTPEKLAGDVVDDVRRCLAMLDGAGATLAQSQAEDPR
jgi:hypothetical protein